MNAKTITKILREANKLALAGFSFHATVLRNAVDAGTDERGAVERVAIMLDKGARFTEAKRLRDLLLVSV